MARVELNIVALGDFTSVNNQIKNLKSQVELLNKSLVGVGIGSNLSKQLAEANSAFKATMLSTGQFTAQTVTLKSETDKFGQSLVTGKLKLTEYFKIIKSGTANATAEMKALALEQTKLQNSIVTADPTKQGVLSVYTPTKINQVANATKIASNMQNLYNIAVDKGSQSLINWGKNTQWAGRQLTVGMTVPLTIFGSTAVQTFQQVNDEIVRLQKVYGTGLVQPTAAAIDAIKTQVLSLSKELASSMGIAAKDTAAMAADLAATGLEGTKLITATREAMRLAKLGELDTQTAMQTTISLQNVYKLSTDKLAGAVDFLNAVENQTSTSLQDLAAGIPKVGPVVQQLGGSFKDTAIMMVAMKEAGVPAAQSANAIKSALASLINPTKAARDAFAAYNIDLAGIATKTGGNPVQMIMMLQDALKGLQPLAQAQLIEKLFGKFQEARIQALISNLGAVNSQTRTAFQLANASEAQLKGIAAGELKTATESTTGKFRRAVETMKADLLPVGEKIMQIATALLNFGNSVAKVFSGLPGPVKTIMGIIAAGVALSGPLIMFTGVLANFVGYLMKAGFAMVSLFKGTKTFGELFTPEIIASQNAAELFSNKILEDETAVVLLNKAVQELTISLEGMAMSMSAAANTNLGSTLLAAEAGLAGGRIPFSGKGKGMATGGFVPGNPADGDAFPAMLMGGEAVIPTAKANQYRPFINAMLKGSLPGFMAGASGVFYGGTRKGKPTTDRPSELLGAAESSLTQGGLLGEQQRLAELTESLSNKYNLSPAQRANISGQHLLNLAHVAPAEYQEVNGAKRKVWDINNLRTSSGAENKALEYVNRTGPLGEAFRGALGAAGASKGKAGEAAAAAIAAGKQPMNKLEQTLFAEAVDSLEGQVKQGKLKNFSSLKTAYVARDIMKARNAGDQGISQDISKLTITPDMVSKAVAKNKEAGKKIGKSAIDAIDKEIDAHSPSNKSRKSGKNIDAGLKLGMEENAAEVKSSAAKVATEAENAIVEKTKGKGLKGRILNSEGKLGVGAKMGGSMALMMGGQAIMSALPKGSNVSNIAGSVSSMAGMGMMFGPWGAAAGAALGLVTGGIGTLMKAEKEHQKVIKDSFKSSATDVQFFGDSVLNTTFKIKAIPNNIKGISDQFGNLNPKIKAFVEYVKQLPKDDNTKIFVDQLAKLTTLPSISGNVLTKVSGAISTGGLDPKHAKDYVMGLLEAAGKADQFTQVWARVQGSIADAGTATTANLNKLNSAVKNTGGTWEYYDEYTKTNVVKGYKELNSEQKGVADQMLTLAGAVTSGTLKYDDLNARLKAIAKSSLGGVAGIDALGAAIKNSGDATAVKAFNNITLALGAMSDQALNTTANVMKLMMLQNMGIGNKDVLSWANSAAGAKAGIGFDDLTSKVGMTDAQIKAQWAGIALKYANSPEFKQKLIDFQKAVNAGVTGGGGGGSGGGGLGGTGKATKEQEALKKLLQGRIKDENATLKSMRDQLSIQQKQAAEAKRIRDFEQQRSDINTQIKQALITGNYLQAAGLKQQISGMTVDFNQSTKDTQMQNQIDTMQTASDAFSVALGELTDAIGQGITKIDPKWTAAAANPIVKPKPINTDVTSGGITVTNNISVSGVNDARLAASHIAAQAHAGTVSGITAAKNNKTNKVVVGGGSNS